MKCHLSIAPFLRGIGGVFLILFLLPSCSRTDSPHSDEEPLYFRIADTLGFRVADVYNPWQKGERLGRWYLVGDSTTEVPSDGVRLQVPLQRVAITSATHIGYLHALGATGKVVAMATPQLVYNRPAQPVIDLGEDITPNIEQLLLSCPDALLVSAYGQNMQNTDRIRQAGVPVIYMVEWREENPLARMQWIRFVGALMGKDHQADSIATAVCEAYHQEQTIGLDITGRRSIMSGASFRGTWYVPAGNTYMGRLFRDAGADYAFSERTADGSIPLNMEQALQVFANADVWVGANASTLDELRNIDPKQTWFRAFQNGEVYNFYRRQNDTGGNDFWETGAVHPEYILRDLRFALYPTTMPDYQPMFLQRLE